MQNSTRRNFLKTALAKAVPVVLGVPAISLAQKSTADYLKGVIRPGGQKSTGSFLEDVIGSGESETGTETGRRQTHDHGNMLYVSAGTVLVRALDKDPIAIGKGEKAIWGNDSIAFHTAPAGKPGIHYVETDSEIIDMNSENKGPRGKRPYLKSLPLYSPSGKGFVQRRDGNLVYSVAGDGKLDERFIGTGSNPQWLDDLVLAYLGNDQMVHMHETNGRQYRRPFGDSCTGFSLSRKKGKIAYTESHKYELTKVMSRYRDTGEDQRISYTALHVLDVDNDDEETATENISEEQVLISTWLPIDSEKESVEYLNPEYSPDGEKVAFVRGYDKGKYDRKSGALEGMDIMLYDGKEAKPILSNLSKDYAATDGIVTWVDEDKLAVNYINNEGKKMICIYSLISNRPIKMFEGQGLSVRR